MLYSIYREGNSVGVILYIEKVILLVLHYTEKVILQVQYCVSLLVYNCIGNRYSLSVTQYIEKVIL